jgi:holliday junction DNA helicase RuvA
MISRLRGQLVEKQPPRLLIEVFNALTYEVYAPMSTFYHLPEIGQEVLLYIHFVVREDSHTLYGFSDPQERALFIQLLKVNGVGPKVALGILSKIEAMEFIACIEQNNIIALQKIPGIGKKTAERLIIEMRDHLAQWHGHVSQFPQINVLTSPAQRLQQDAIAALMALGYKTQEATRAIQQVQKDNLSVEELIRSALRVMS